MPSGPIAGSTIWFSTKSMEVSMTFWMPRGHQLRLSPGQPEQEHRHDHARSCEMRAILLNAYHVPSPNAAGHFTIRLIGGNSTPPPSSPLAASRTAGLAVRHGEHLRGLLIFCGRYGLGVASGLRPGERQRRRDVAHLPEEQHQVGEHSVMPSGTSSSHEASFTSRTASEDEAQPEEEPEHGRGAHHRGGDSPVTASSQPASRKFTTTMAIA